MVRVLAGDKNPVVKHLIADKAGLAANGIRPFDGPLQPLLANVNTPPTAAPETGLIGSLRVMTPKGETAIEDIQIGTEVICASGAVAHVRHVLTAPPTRHAVRLRAPYFGLNQDSIIGAEHRLAITSDVAGYLFGEDTVLVPAWALRDGRKVTHWELGPRHTLYQLQLNAAAALKIGRCAIESMPKAGQAIGRVLTTVEARCFAAEYRSGYQS